MFCRAIVDECGTVRYWCNELSEFEIQELLDEHEEWRIRCIPQ